MTLHVPIPRALEGAVYPCPNLRDFTLDENDLERTCPLDLGHHSLDPQCALGMLDELPLEILSEILAQVDIRSLMDFRRVNQRAMQVVDSISQFRTIVRHCPNSLRGILSVEAGSYISCQDLYCTLRTSRCEKCDDFGGYIYVLDCSRVCFLCISERHEYLPLSASDAIRSFGINRMLLASLHSMRSVPGCYSPNQRNCRTRLLLIDSESARRAGVARHGSVLAMEQHVARAASKSLEEYHKRVSQKAAGVPGPVPRQPPSAMVRGKRTGDARRFMAAVHAPWVDMPTNSAEWGFHCVGCERQYRCRPLHWRRKYIVNTFNDHILECGRIINGSHCLLAGMAKTG